MPVASGSLFSCERASGSSRNDCRRRNGVKAPPGRGESRSLPFMTSAAPAQEKTFFGHPGGLSTLFFTEMWERFSYYGMRALLVLFMIAPDRPAATRAGHRRRRGQGDLRHLHRLVYLMPVPGGWVADRCSAAAARCCTAASSSRSATSRWPSPAQATFWLGLLPHRPRHRPAQAEHLGAWSASSTTEDDTRRDAGFSIFYMGINIGALLAPLGLRHARRATSTGTGALALRASGWPSA